MSKAGFDKFSNATVDALEKEKERIVKLESLTQYKLKKLKSNNRLILE